MDDIRITLSDFNSRSLQRIKYADLQNKLLVSDNEAYRIFIGRIGSSIACS